MDLVRQFTQENLPALLLNGDILGLSFSSYKESLNGFAAFVDAFTNQNKICDKVIFISGNHDHHIWNLAKEEHFLAALKQSKSREVPDLQHITPATYDQGFNSDFFQAFMQSGATSPTEFKIFYPNFLLPPNKAGEPAILFHHGHFAEKAYYFISKAMQAFYPSLHDPGNLEELESENGDYIDYIFSGLGRSGKAGNYFEKLMATMGSQEKLEEHVQELSENLAHAIDFPYLPFHWMEKVLASTLLRKISTQVRFERYRGQVACSDETLKGLMHYLDAYCSDLISSNKAAGHETVFIWGHTHKPFEKITKTSSLGSIKVLNSGGWVIPSTQMSLIGGSVILINQQNEAVSLRIFNDGEDGGTMQFKILLPDGTSETPFTRRIMQCLYGENNTLLPVWEKFKSLLSDEIKHRRKSNGE